MAVCDPVLTNATSQVSRASERIEGIAADLNAHIYNAEFTSTDMGEGEQGSIENPNITAAGSTAVPLGGSIVVSGSTVALPDADAFLPCAASALKRVSDATDLGGGAFEHIYSQNQPNQLLCSYTLRTDRGDGIISQTVGTKCFGFDGALATDTAPGFTLTEEAQFVTFWAQAVERHPNPATGRMYFRGSPDEWIDRQDGNAGDAYFKLVDLALSAGNKEIATFHAISGRPGRITGTWTVSAGTSAFAGTGGAALTDIVQGDILDVDGQLLEVAAPPTNDNTFTTVGTHTAGATAAILIRAYGAEAAARLVSSLVQPGKKKTNQKNIWNEMSHSSGGPLGDPAGAVLEMHLDSSAGIVAGTIGALTGTVSVAVGSDVVTGSGTLFLSEAQIGAFVDTPLTLVGGKRVIAITDDLTMRVDSNYGSVETGVTMNLRPIPQVTLTGGDYSTASDLTITAIGGAMLTELSPGSWFRTAGGEVRRIDVITDNDNATVTFAFANTEANVAATTDYEWRAPREIPSFLTVPHPSGPFPILRAKTQVFLRTPGSQEEEIPPESLTWTYLAGYQARLVVGSPWATGIQVSGQSSGTIEALFPKDTTVFDKATRTQERGRIKVVLRSAEEIGTSGFVFSWTWLFHLKATGKAIVIPDDVTNQTRLGGTLHADPLDPDGLTDDVVLIVVSDEPLPLPIV